MTVEYRHDSAEEALLRAIFGERQEPEPSMKIRFSRANVSGLCDTCRNGQIVEMASGKVLVECAARSGTDNKIWEPVKNCSMYRDRRHPTIYEMEEIAWILKTTSRSKAAGFVKPGTKEHKKLVRKDYPED